MKIMRWVITAALATAALTGCGMLQASLTVLNNTATRTITEVHLTPSTSSTSEYRLDVHILPGSTHVVESVWAGTYVLYAEDSEGGIWERPNYVLQRGRDYAWTLTDGDRIDP